MTSIIKMTFKNEDNSDNKDNLKNLDDLEHKTTKKRRPHKWRPYLARVIEDPPSRFNGKFHYYYFYYFFVNRPIANICSMYGFHIIVMIFLGIVFAM